MMEFRVKEMVWYLVSYKRVLSNMNIKVCKKKKRKKNYRIPLQSRFLLSSDPYLSYHHSSRSKVLNLYFILSYLPLLDLLDKKKK